MKTVHLFANSFGWSNITEHSASTSQWADEARHNGHTVVFHPSEAAARAAAEGHGDRRTATEINLGELLRKAEAAATVEKGAARVLVESFGAALTDLATAREDAASAQSDVLACQRENERLKTLIARSRELLKDSATPFDTACTILASA